MALPRFLVLKSVYSGKYLRYVHEDVQIHGFIQFSGEEVVSPYAKFELEPEKSGNGMVHIRSCYNNKYLVRQSQCHYWIHVAADQTEEDQSKWACTLFKPEYVNAESKTIRLIHVQLGNYACLWRAAQPLYACVLAGYKDHDKDSCDVYTIIDWESLLIMPKHVTFKGDNGKYLSACTIENHPYLQFLSNDKGDSTVGNEVFTLSDGNIRIKSDYFGKFWRRSPNWIWADSSDTTNNNSDTLFWPVKVNNNVVALRNLGNNYFCKRLTTEGKTDCLNAAVNTISKEAQMELEELVISREIYNVNFRLLDARIYDQIPLTMATEVAINSTQQANEAEVKVSHTKTTRSTWNASVSLKLGVTTTIKAGIPFIAEGRIETSAELVGAYQWGETKETTNQIETAYKVTVPPRTIVTVSLLATKGSCDIPFSYVQRELLTNGNYVTTEMNDGVYTGINSYNLKYETKQDAI